MPANVQRAPVGGEVDRQLTEVGSLLPSATLEEPSKLSVLGVKLPTLLKMWDKWRQAGNSSCSRANEAQLRALWCSVARGSAWDKEEITKCIEAVRKKLLRDATLRAKVLDDGSFETRFDRWMHFILTERALPKVKAVIERLWNMLEGRGPAPQEPLLGADPVALQRLHLTLAAKDIDRTKVWSISEMLKMYYELLCVDQALSESVLVEEANCFVIEVLPQLGLRGDEALTYPEFLSLLLGRVESDVVLYMYDLSNGAAKVANITEGIWHTSIHVYGWEYLYSGKCVYVEPGMSCFGKPEKTIYMGSTLARRSELHNYCISELSEKFTAESYDVVRNNCNHFTDKILHFLCGVNVPHEVMHQTDRLLELPGVQALWPVMTTWVTSLVPAQRVLNGDMSRENTLELNHDNEPSNDPANATMGARIPPKPLQSTLPPRSDDASSTAPTDTGGERSNSFGDGDSVAAPARRVSAAVTEPRKRAPEELPLIFQDIACQIQDLQKELTGDERGFHDENDEPPPKGCCFPILSVFKGNGGGQQYAIDAEPSRQGRKASDKHQIMSSDPPGEGCAASLNHTAQPSPGSDLFLKARYHQDAHIIQMSI